MRLLALFVAVPLVAVPLAPLAAQHAQHAGPPGDSLGRYPRELIERPVPVRTGLRRLRDPVTTRSADAQVFHEQGLSYLHSFAYLEAARAFHQALRHDSTVALAWLGLHDSYANLGIEDGQAARLARAESLAASASPRERWRVRLGVRAERLDWRSTKQDAVARRAAFKAMLDSALLAHGDDAELWLMRAQYEEMRTDEGDPAPAAFYETVLARAPGHMAAHHYLIHFYEGLGRIDLAVKHGEAYAEAAPGIAHAQHMYGHDLRRVGRVDDAIREFSEADSIERAYYASENVPREYDWHHPHNLTLLALAHQYQGRVAEAERLLRDKATIRPLGSWNEYYNRQSVPEFLVLRARWSEALEAGRALQGNAAPGARAAGHLWAGWALLGQGDARGAGDELAKARRALGKDGGRSGTFLGPQLETLDGAIALRGSGRRRDKAIAQLAGVQRRHRAQSGPDAWIEALFGLELIARTARDAGAWEFARASAQEMVAHDSAYAGAHYAVGLAHEALGDPGAARSAFARAVALWAKADTGLPELADARRRLGAVAGREEGGATR
jgi:tetratricopeptide (TPR) repeat protein